VSSVNRHETVANLTFRGFAYYGPKTEVKRYKSFGREQRASPPPKPEEHRTFLYEVAAQAPASGLSPSKAMQNIKKTLRLPEKAQLSDFQLRNIPAMQTIIYEVRDSLEKSQHQHRMSV
jgi:hypothetical protein